MKIEIGKTYITRDGHKARVICTDRLGKYPIVALVKQKNKERICDYMANGRISLENEHFFDLEYEHDIWLGVEVDTPIYVRKSDNGIWLPRHFAKYENGRIFAWDDGRTSFTSEKSSDITYWKYGKQRTQNDKR